ncbi:hypothetical protein SAMN05444000_105193 [Shimia gijangensis]|uniref:Uncharacterized protein n=1 Tax=Shimia gijangensis TaxID=1470563 RepID=A0A1M6H1K7_9RHOB|nr:hypothetical protein SAMN05444000_105193 [Shimia gijangensis]
MRLSNPISGPLTGGKIAYFVLQLQKDMRILHRCYAFTPYPNHLLGVITGATPKRQEQ